MVIIIIMESYCIRDCLWTPPALFCLLWAAILNLCEMPWSYSHHTDTHHSPSCYVAFNKPIQGKPSHKNETRQVLYYRTQTGVKKKGNRKAAERFVCKSWYLLYLMLCSSKNLCSSVWSWSGCKGWCWKWSGQRPLRPAGGGGKYAARD